MSALIIIPCATHYCTYYDNRWFCHVDDDTYVNVPELKKTLVALYNHKPQYAGHYPRYHIQRYKDGVPVSNIAYVIYDLQAIKN